MYAISSTWAYVMPGEMIRSGGRKHVNLSPFLRYDPRNIAVGRQHDSYDTITIFRKDRVLSEHDMLMSANGIVATTEVLRSDLIQLIYVVPSEQYKRWVLYDPDLRDLVPCGYTATEMSRSYYKDALWEHKRRVAGDSYACPNPHCRLFNPTGFTACVACGCKFTFEAVLGPSKVALPVAGGTFDDAEITAKEFEDYGLRVAKHAIRAQEKKVLVYKENFFLWRQVLRCLDWRKWDLVWTREDKLNKFQKGGSRWHSGEKWERPSPKVFERMSREYPEGIPDADEFYARHHKCLVDKTHPDHAFLATYCVYCRYDV